MKKTLIYYNLVYLFTIVIIFIKPITRRYIYLSIYLSIYLI